MLWGKMNLICKSIGRVLNMRKWMRETCHQPQIVSHPGRFTQGKSMYCLAVKNQSHQSHDHRHEQYPPRVEDKSEEVRETA